MADPLLDMRDNLVDVHQLGVELQPDGFHPKTTTGKLRRRILTRPAVWGSGNYLVKQKSAGIQLGVSKPDNKPMVPQVSFWETRWISPANHKSHTHTSSPAASV